MSNITQLTKQRADLGLKFHKRRAVAPVIATLLLVAIAVVGGSIIFVFSQGFFASAQVSGTIDPELVKIFGYDTRDVSPLKIHNGLDIDGPSCCGVADGKRNIDERIALYIQNNSAKPITIEELRFGGVEYQYIVDDRLGPWNPVNIGPQPGEYLIMTGPDGKIDGDVLQEDSPKISAGGIVTLVLDLDRALNDGRDIQVKLTTSSGNVFISTIFAGQNVS